VDAVRKTPLAKLLASPAATKRVTALDAFALAQKTWHTGERIDIGKLADELGVARATVFRWVGSREQLYGEVVSAAFAQSIEAARRQSKGKGAAFLTDVTRNLLTSLSKSKSLRAFIRHDAEFALRIVMSSASPVEGRVIAAVRELIVAEAEAGHLHPEIDVASLAYVIVRIAESFLYRDVLTGDPPNAEVATKAIGMMFAAQASRRR